MKTKTIWDAKTIEAFEFSIAHWNRLASGKRRADEAVGSTDCALCGLFLTESSTTTCRGCPVAERTGKTHCTGSPYHAAAEAVLMGYRSKEFRAAAKRECEFLEGLRPTPKTGA